MTEPRRPSTALLVGVMAAGHVAMTMMLPAVPEIARAYGSEAARVQLTFTAYLVTYAVAQLAAGPMSDAYGRRPLLVGGMALFLAGSLGCLLARDVATLTVARVLQGAGACTGLVVTRAVVRDVYETAESARVLAFITATLGLAPAVAPMIGGLLVVYLGWRSVFWLTLAYAAAILALTYAGLPETRAAVAPRHGVAALGRGFTWLLRSRAFLAYSGIPAAASAAFYAYLAAAPLVLIETMGVSPDGFGVLSLLFPAGFTIGGYVCSHVTRRVGIDRMIRAGAILFVLCALVMTALPLAGIVTVAATMAPVFVIGFAHGLMVPNAMAGSLGARPAHAGSAAALAGFAHSAAGAAASAAAALFVYRTQLPMGAIIATTALAALVCSLVLGRGAGEQA